MRRGLEIEVLRKTSISMVAKEAAILLSQCYGVPDIEYQNRFMKIGQKTNQFHVDCVFSDSDRDLDIAQFSERFIAPAVHALANRIPRGICFGPLELMSGCQASRQYHNGVSIRCCAGWYERPILAADGKVVSYEPPVPILRMDVIVTTESEP